MDPILKFENFSFKYRTQKKPTLTNINFSVYPGEKILIVGPSGSGKSTLAHCINGLVPFSYTGDITGAYEVAGKNPAGLGIFGLSKHVGTVLQDTDGQFIGLTVAEDLAFTLENDCIPTKQLHEAVDRVAEEVDVTELLQHSPSELSGGQKQRVSMGGVMIADVDILLLDEPLANLDPAAGLRTMDLVEKINREKGTTIIIIEHRLEDALRCHPDRIVVFKEGTIAADLPAADLLCSDILQKSGIREPLYLSALRYAGAEYTPENNPQDIEKMDLSGCREAVQNWHMNYPAPAAKEPGETVLEGRNLCFSYDGKEQVLQDVSFRVYKGEMLAIAGRNGAGKTTLSNLVCGFITPTEGDILLNGEDISDLSIAQRGEKIGLVMQNPNQMISKSMIKEEVALGLAVREVAPEIIEEKVDKVLKICGLYPFRNWPVSALSFGQKKRVTIASILVMDPEILILDEPTAGQDWRHYTDIMEFLREINRNLGITIIMITHDMHLMLEYTDRTLVLTGGKLLADASPAAVLTNPEIAEKASLKRTSLYDLAVRCDIPDPTVFAEQFIQKEEQMREQGMPWEAEA